MYLYSDNTGPALPQVMERVIAANTGYQKSYGDDALMDEVSTRLREVFEAPDAAVFLVSTGTAANVLALSCYTQPWQRIYCSKVSHIEIDECNGPEFYTGGAKLHLIDTGDKISLDGFKAAIAETPIGDIHCAQPGPLSITSVTERGTVYSLAEIRALTEVAKTYGIPVHLDGARFTNAMVNLGCTAAEMTWKSGVDVVSFGGTKNGCMGVEAVIFFDPSKALEFELRRKRGAHLFSKHRFLSAQMAGYLKDNAFVEAAKSANATAAYLAAGLRDKGVTFLHEPQANMLFIAMEAAQSERLKAAGAQFGPFDIGDPDRTGARLVCDWSLSREDVDRFLSLF